MDNEDTVDIEKVASISEKINEIASSLLDTLNDAEKVTALGLFTASIFAFIADNNEFNDNGANCMINDFCKSLKIATKELRLEMEKDEE